MFSRAHTLRLCGWTILVACSAGCGVQRAGSTRDSPARQPESAAESETIATGAPIFRTAPGDKSQTIRFEGLQRETAYLIIYRGVDAEGNELDRTRAREYLGPDTKDEGVSDANGVLPVVVDTKAEGVDIHIRVTVMRKNDPRKVESDEQIVCIYRPPPPVPPAPGPAPR